MIRRNQLVNCRLITLDLEGFDLGKFGKISTIQIALSDPNQQFIYDILSLVEIPKELRRILTNDKIMKLMFDCRNDSAALFSEYDVQLAGIFDLQLKEIMERTDTVDEFRLRLHGICC